MANHNRDPIEAMCIKKCMGILKSLNVVILHRVISNLKLEINVKLPQLRLYMMNSSDFVGLELIAYQTLKNASNQCGTNSVTAAPWHTKSRPRMLVVSKATFLKNYLPFSTCILSRSSIECHAKKHQRFSLSGVRFGSQEILISW